MSAELNPTTVQLPFEPCVVISDGDGTVVVATDRTCEMVRQFGLHNGPVVRATTVARLRAFADLIAAIDREQP